MKQLKQIDSVVDKSYNTFRDGLRVIHRVKNII